MTHDFEEGIDLLETYRTPKVLAYAYIKLRGAQLLRAIDYEKMAQRVMDRGGASVRRNPSAGGSDIGLERIDELNAITQCIQTAFDWCNDRACSSWWSVRIEERLVRKTAKLLSCSSSAVQKAVKNVDIKVAEVMLERQLLAEPEIARDTSRLPRVQVHWIDEVEMNLANIFLRGKVARRTAVSCAPSDARSA